MKTVIQIQEETLDILEVLNSGVRPGIEEDQTFYVFEGMDKHAQIVDREWFEENCPNWVYVRIGLIAE